MFRIQKVFDFSGPLFYSLGTSIAIIWEIDRGLLIFIYQIEKNLLKLSVK